MLYLAIIGVMVWLFGSTFGERSKNSITLYELIEVGFAVIVCIWGKI